MIIASNINAQTKVSGVVVNNNNKPLSFANVYFRNTNVGVITNEDGRFYVESAGNHTYLVVSFIGYTSQEVILEKSVTYNMKIVLQEGESLKELTLYSGKTSKKNNPALDILRKIWERKRKNGLRQFDQYQMDKYEKVEFDMNTIDSAFISNKIFKGMEFIFDKIDTSSITGKTYLPIFINESIFEVYGDNTTGKKKEIIKAIRNSGFSNNQQITAFVKDLYNEYDIYDNYLYFFDKSFVSPLSKTGIDVYNYVLADTTYIDNKRCYNIVYYPRRKGELTFKGDFWVNDTTFAIKKINMEVTKSANINWIKEIYIEQEFEVLNDSVFLLKRDYMMTDFSLSKKEESKGVYGKRTTLFQNHQFNIKKSENFFRVEVNYYDPEVHNKTEEYWAENRFETLNRDESGIYKMLDTLKTVPRFKQLCNLVSILGSGYIQRGNFDYGPLFSTFGYNDVEGFRLRVGGRTYFDQNDLWRIQGYTAYGFKDDQFKYGLSGKWLVGRKNRVILEAGHRRDIEQIGASLTTTNDVLGRSLASSSLFITGTNGKLTSINLTMLSANIEPVRNLTFETGFTYRTLKSASSIFSLDYFTDLSLTEIASQVKQAELNFMIEITPNRRTIGYGVERNLVDNYYTRLFVNYSQGIKGVFNSDFQYEKIQLFYRQPIIIGVLGRLFTTVELGKIYGAVPLGLMGVVPGNQSYFIIDNTFNLLNYYEFVVDSYVSLGFEHHFNGRILARIPLLRDLNLREIVGVKGIYGTVTDKNRMINASRLEYVAPEDIYWEYNVGIENIFKVLRIDFAWRGSYLNTPNANRFGIKGSFGFYF